MKQVFNEKIKEIVDDSNDRSDYFTSERCNQIILEVKEAKLLKDTKKPLSSKQYKRLKRFDIITVGDNDKLIEKTGKTPTETFRYYCKTEDLFDILETAHMNMNSVLNEVQEIKGIVRLILLKLNSSENYSKNEANICDDSLIRDLVPITCIENLLKFENTLLQNEEASKQLCNKLRLTGGTNPKNFTPRCLSILMTNEVAALCCWTGQKKNFKICGTELINIAKKAIRANYPKVNDKEFEVFVTDWLRFANQRKLKALK